MGAAIAATLSTSAAFAQDKSDTGLEVVVVTAQRTAQQLQNVPMSVQAITQKQLELQGIGSGEQLTAMVPNLVVGSESSTGLDSTVAIRGIPEVGLYIDGVWQPSIGFREAGIIETQRIEILRGPQGTLFGRNTNGGAINYITVPPARDFHINGGVELGSWNRKFVNVSVDIPLSDKLLTKWTAAIQDQGGFVKSLLNGNWYGGLNNHVFRGDILWKPSDNFNLRVTGTEAISSGTPAMEERFTGIQTVGSKGANIQNVAAYNIVMQNPEYGPYNYWTSPTAWSTRFNNGNKWTAQNNSWMFPGGRVGKWQNDETEPLDSENKNTKQVAATATWNINNHLTFTNIAAFINQDSYHFDNDPAAPVYEWDQARLFKYTYLSEEAHLEGHFLDDKLSFLAGAYYLRTRQRQRTYSWAYQEFYTSSGSDPILSQSNTLVLDQNMINFVHQWGAANANTALGKTLDPMTNRTLAADMAAWKPNFTSGGMPPTSATDFTNMITDNINNDYSLFFNGTWHPTSKIDLQAGIRAAWNNGVNQFEVPVGAFRTFLLPMTGGGKGYGPGSKFGYSSVAMTANPYPGGVTFTPMATLTYHFTDQVNAFFRYAGGYTTGSASFNAALNANVVLDPEKVHDYELGIRSDWFNHKLRANLTGYFMMWDGKQISTSIPVGTTFAVVTTSGGQSRAMGFEAEVLAVLAKGLQVEASVANLNTRWLKSGSQNIPPDTLWALAPKWTFHLAGQYKFELPHQAEMTLRADYGYQSEYQRDSDPGRQLLAPEPGYGLLNGRIQYTPKGGRWNVQIFGTNLLDKAYVDAGTGSVYLFGVDAAYLGQRRTLGARLNFNY